MRTVVIVGAGGSLAQAQSCRPARPRQHPPLDADFFVKAQVLERSDPFVRMALGRLRKTLNTFGGFPDPFISPSPSLETFFADVYYEVAASRSSAALPVYAALLDLYAHVLGAT